MLDKQFPPATPTDYIIRYNRPGEDAPEQTPELKAFDQSASTWLSGAAFPRDIGNTLVNTIWRNEQRQVESQGRTRQVVRAGQDELTRLKRENETLRKERDFLRRAAAFFARESQ